MIKYAIVSINLLFVFLFSLFVDPSLIIEQDVPEKLAPGEEVTVQVSIAKGAISGFAKLQLYVPEGISVSPVNTEGASFTFKDNKAKFIWMSLPTEKTFNITYQLKASEKISGYQVIAGRFSYIAENERKTFYLMDEEVYVGFEEVTPKKEESVPKQLQPMNAIGLEQHRPPAYIKGSRTVTALGKSEFLVEIEIEKGDIEGFGKIHEQLPFKCKITASETASAIFTASDHQVKFVWMNLPQQKVMKVAYKIKGKFTPEHLPIDGSFSYLVDNTIKKRRIYNAGEAQLDEQVLAKQEQLKAQLDAYYKREAERKKRLQTDPVAQIVKAKSMPATGGSQQTPIAEKKQKTVPSSPIRFSVQIAAGHYPVTRSHFQRRYQLEDPFQMETHQGWLKYTVGRFSTYREARDKREQIRSENDIAGAFVASYNGEKRITVQEALAIARQDWLQ